jgi:hypothetical protein
MSAALPSVGSSAALQSNRPVPTSSFSSLRVRGSLSSAGCVQTLAERVNIDAGPASVSTTCESLGPPISAECRPRTAPRSCRLRVRCSAARARRAAERDALPAGSQRGVCWSCGRQGCACPWGGAYARIAWASPRLSPAKGSKVPVAYKPPRRAHHITSLDTSMGGGYGSSQGSLAADM